ncbi:late embryogenesis abundant protein At1g64065-like [Alnus glutinosa]|uniref:late embryogenesis abundant protein At1g64065-like n=1 Tax=Alnus glutinosa TaxID=3517 RepID=UPI002D793FC6|nr:late embryogenesis abundant protein At1g64065-like [Alnus glutinosa]XP_062167348.1 late embryogenesis abundant protein At1g64065-like [Alnus glutinosa]
MEVEGKAGKPSGKRRKTCCIAVIGSLVGIVILMVILAFTVFKSKRPVTSYDNLSIEDLDVSLDIAKVKVYLNVTLGVDISIHNPNKVGFKYQNSTALLNYRGDLVGELPLLAGDITAGGTEHLNLTLTVMADRLLSSSNIFSDVTSGVLPFNTFVKLSGKVKILFFKIHADTSSSCDFNIYISNRTIGDQQCKYKTKF